jgi:hypothetical protein
MKVPLPTINLSAENIVENRRILVDAVKQYKGAIQACEGLLKANAALCEHPQKVKHYDPGYGGGGYSHSECQICGARLL